MSILCKHIPIYKKMIIFAIFFGILLGCFRNFYYLCIEVLFLSEYYDELPLL